MEIKLLSGEYDQWDRYVQASPSSFSYHLSGWKRVVERSFKHKTFYLMAIEDSKLVGILPLVSMKSLIFGRSLVSLPFFNYGGVLADSAEIEEELIQRAISIAKEEKAEYLELRYMRMIDLGMPVKAHKVTMILELKEDVDKQWEAYKSIVRNRIRKAESYGLKASIGGIENLDSFYNVFARNMRDLGTPVYSKLFFKNILETFPERAKIHTVHLKDKIIGAAISFTFQETIEVPWVSSIRDYFKLNPNNILYDSIIKYACNNKIKYFDFGRSTPDSGTYRFKKQWGAVPKQLYWYYWLANGSNRLPNVSPENSKYKIFISIWKKLPLPLSRIIGPRIVKNIP